MLAWPTHRLPDTYHPCGGARSRVQVLRPPATSPRSAPSSLAFPPTPGPEPPARELRKSVLDLHNTTISTLSTSPPKGRQAKQSDEHRARRRTAARARSRATSSAFGLGWHFFRLSPTT